MNGLWRIANPLLYMNSEVMSYKFWLILFYMYYLSFDYRYNIYYSIKSVFKICLSSTKLTTIRTVGSSVLPELNIHQQI